MLKREKIAAAVLLSVLLALPAGALGSLHVETVKSPVNGPGVSFSCEYPRLSGIGDSGNQEKVNRALHEQALCAKKRAEYAAQRAPVSGEFRYEVTRNEGGLFSLVTTRRLTQNGSTSVKRTGLTLNTADGRPFVLSDLFVKEADYPEVLGEKVKAQIAQKGLSRKQRRPFRRLSSGQDFYLTKDALVLIVPQGTLFSADCGVQEFKLSLQSLDGTLAQEFQR